MQKKADERLLWNLVCNCSKLEYLCVDSRNEFITSHIHWCCYRPPVSKSLTSLFVDSYCKIDQTTMEKLARAVEKASALTRFRLDSPSAYYTDITRLVLGDNQLETLSLELYAFNETESLALLLAAARKHQNCLQS